VAAPNIMLPRLCQINLQLDGRRSYGMHVHGGLGVHAYVTCFRWYFFEL
jgi:hypothetical protein